MWAPVPAYSRPGVLVAASPSIRVSGRFAAYALTPRISP
jgi:hypothetical protein